MLAGRGVPVAQSHVVRDREALRKRVRKLVKERVDLIVVCGGDGAQTTACAELARSKSTLGVIPGGTGNSFAQTLGIPHDLEAAVDVLVRGKCERVDLGCVNGKYFANFSTIGLTAEVGARTPHWLKQIAGSFAYAITAVPPLFTERPIRARIRSGRKRIKLKTYQIVVASGRFFGTKPLTPDASPTDGRLTFFTTTGQTRFDLLRMYLAVANGTQASLPDAQYFNAEKVKIKTRKRHMVSIDGDFGGYTPATYSVVKRALRVMVP